MIKLRQRHETKLQISREVRDFGEFVRAENFYDYRLLLKNSREVVVGATGFEPATARPPGVCATRLRYAPKLSTMEYAFCKRVKFFENLHSK